MQYLISVLENEKLLNKLKSIICLQFYMQFHTALRDDNEPSETDWQSCLLCKGVADFANSVKMLPRGNEGQSIRLQRIRPSLCSHVELQGVLMPTT